MPIRRAATQSRHPPHMCRYSLISVIAAVILVISPMATNALQFVLEDRGKRCFYEYVPVGTEAVLSYSIAQGHGEMAVQVRLTDASGAHIFTKRSADRGVFTFRTPDIAPVADKRSGWALLDDDTADPDDAFFRQQDLMGDSRIPYAICFEHPRSLHLPRLAIRDHPVQRRIIFSVRYGAQSKSQEFYDSLAKEKHLSSTEELFRVVEDRVTDIVRLIDEMRQREVRMSIVTKSTNRVVAWYSTLACLTIAVGAIVTSQSTITHLAKHRYGR